MILKNTNKFCPNVNKNKHKQVKQQEPKYKD